MLYSMTGFARVTLQTSWGSAQWELRTVNNRYLEMNLRLPESLRGQEMALRELAKKHCQRGKFDAQLKIQLSQVATTKLQVNEGLLNQLLQVCDRMAKQLPEVTPLDRLRLLQWPDVIQTTDLELPDVEKDIKTLFVTGLKELQQARLREGDKLTHFLLERLTEFQQHVAFIESRSENVISEIREKMRQKVLELAVDCDQSRLTQEIVLQAQRVDICEELSRLHAHIQEARRVCDAAIAQGRTLDFLMQELQRETNTLGAKCNNIEISQHTVQMKVLIDQMREQIQNIE